jgi:hypothetical protein
MTSPIRVLRQIVAPNGKHRPRRPLLLPDTPIAPAVAPVAHVVLNEDELTQLLDEGQAEPIECAHCPCCNRTTAHAMHRDGSRRCWTCGTESPAGGAAA